MTKYALGTKEDGRHMRDTATQIGLREEFYLPGYETIKSAQSQPMFHVSPPSPLSENKPNKKQA